MDNWGGVLAALLPSVGVGVIFWFSIRAIVNADRRERQELARLEAQGPDGVPPGRADS
ncbi:hypothetical protein [Cellulomonas sp. JZ18]|uniref:hypothetical protein n=1 Tax=Cellulomonas sp. JZ18 TaxID=2654191 RepID=UPI0018AFFE52|nr:hypothetical protein [Cellulomonas sp. JZ18]